MENCEVDNLKEKVLNEIKKFNDLSGDKCGLRVVDLKNRIGVSYQEIKPVLRELFNDKKITVKEGLNGKLLMYGSSKKK